MTQTHTIELSEEQKENLFDFALGNRKCDITIALNVLDIMELSESSDFLKHATQFIKNKYKTWVDNFKKQYGDDLKNASNNKNNFNDIVEMINENEAIFYDEMQECGYFEFIEEEEKLNKMKSNLNQCINHFNENIDNYYDLSKEQKESLNFLNVSIKD